MACVPGYEVVLCDTSLDRILAYKKRFDEGAATVGARLAEQLKAIPPASSAAQYIGALLATKLPIIFAESAVRGDGTDWNAEEICLLGDINVAMQVKIFDNGVWAPGDKYFEEYATPFNGYLMFTPGALLKESVGDYGEVVGLDGQIDQSKYNQLQTRRILPLLAYANQAAKRQGKMAFITAPGIGCSNFAGKFKGKVEQYLNNAFKYLFERHAPKLSYIKCFRFGPFNERNNEEHVYGGIVYRVRPGSQVPSQLVDPVKMQEGADDFGDCILFKLVGWDHVSLPGNDYFASSRFTDDGVSAAATNSMQIVTGVKGQYFKGHYLPPEGFSSWEKVALRNKTRLVVDKNIMLVSEMNLDDGCRILE